MCRPIMYDQELPRKYVTPPVIDIVGIACNICPADAKKIIGSVTIRGESIGDVYSNKAANDLDNPISRIIWATIKPISN